MSARAAIHDVDKLLVKNVLKGHPEAERTFVDRMGCVERILHAQNTRLGRPLSQEDLADLTQDSLLIVWRKLGDYSGRAALETWVYRICFLELMNRVRAHGRRKEVLEALADDTLSPAAPTATLSPRGDADIERLLRFLSEREAVVVRLRHVEDLDLREIAGLLDLSISSVKTHYYRALEKLRQQIEMQRKGESR